jgi:hypothetical protein
VKTCKKCGETKALTQFRTRKSRAKLPNNRLFLRSQCKACEVKNVVDWQKRNPDKVKVIKAREHKTNAERYRMYARTIGAVNGLKSDRLDRKLLRDKYIKGMLTRYNVLSFKDIPQALIEAKRYELLIKRNVRDAANN